MFYYNQHRVKTRNKANPFIYETLAHMYIDNILVCIMLFQILPLERFWEVIRKV